MSDTAAWKDTTVRIKEHTFNLKRGQLVTTIRFMSKGFSISDRATRTLLENLKKHGKYYAVCEKSGKIDLFASSSLEEIKKTMRSI
jgi:hypothetical protein